MSLQGPVVVVSDHPHRDIASAVADAGGFPVIEARQAEAAAAIAKIDPTAVVLAEPLDDANERLNKALAANHSPFLPVVARMSPGARVTSATVLPTAPDAAAHRIVARLRSASRVRMLHATVLRRAETPAQPRGTPDRPRLPDGDPLEDASVLVLGRGRSYPALSVAVGERVGVVGALGVESAARQLNARDLDGILIGDGFSPRVIDAFLTVLGEDVRFRDLPVAVLAGLSVDADCERLPNFERIAGGPTEVVERFLPLVRLHAFEGRLRRLLSAIEANGMVDPQTGLFTKTAFMQDLERALQDAHETGANLSVARFALPQVIGKRTNSEAARLAGRLLRGTDFACRAGDGAILLAFAGTDLRSAHVVARRIASIIKHTMLAADLRDCPINPTLTLASLKSTDTVESLLARVSETDRIAAE